MRILFLPSRDAWAIIRYNLVLSAAVEETRRLGRAARTRRACHNGRQHGPNLVVHVHRIPHDDCLTASEGGRKA
ncbi:hypothetical protein PsYK624_038620 [Phanerochaete sordida]|uniref:Uncharacterized protein n=1 Tax=Phanerochaete sordida TaxID=48140 RepID=A0A9P3G4M9_9APHY|nr:hypothetical protein PsYK624_038620 [Phanerochaete sordida]